ncbi:dynamin family protein [Aerosakkonema funiforme]|uniref:Dynamin family protein n=2 Tax=Oscillatoriophycideae TaxID=1301283 RepID=A0A926VHR0_9CYAN|nr:dynamin family protein [Aerosakkonema funiforme]MBD2183945.1 dynamin family protein [Aerosakkonema funiforme FACHB-1375]
METEKLNHYKQYGKSIGETVESLSQSLSLPDWVSATLPNALTRLGEAAKKTVDRATSPVKIGVMGEFNAGKTLLLGSLIGYGDALPVSANPTTGNVTAIHLIQQEGFQTTQVEEFAVEYLSDLEVKECLQFMLKEADKRATDASINSEQLKALHRLNVNEIGIWQDTINWCETVWKSSNNLDLRYLLRELILFVRTYERWGILLGKQYSQIDPIVARQGLQLADAEMDIQNLRFEDMPLPAPGKSNQVSIESLQNSFPLIRRVNLKVRVSRDIWDLSGLAGAEEFILLDFPGLGAANSGVRDTFLSLRELEEVQTILIILKGNEPGGATANKIFTMMQQQKPGVNLKERILVGVGRFDQLPLENEGGERILDEMIEENAIDDILPFEDEPLSENSVLEKLKVLKTTVASAQAFTTEKNRIFLLSPLWGLGDLAKNSSNVQVGSPEFMANLDYLFDRGEKSRQLREKWQRLSEKLQGSDRRSTLARQLGDLAENGGIVRLRESILNHVKEHGFKQLLDDTRSAAENLHKQQDELRHLLEGIQQDIPIPENKNFVKLREAIESLVKTYNEFQQDLGKKSLQDRRGVQVSEAIKDELIFRIFSWPHWNLLFQQADDGIIKLPESTNIVDEILGDLEAGDDTSIPVQSEDFYPEFAQMVREMEGFTRETIANPQNGAIALLLNELSAKVQNERNAIAEILPPEKIEEIKQTKRENVRSFQILVQGGTEPKMWLNGLLKKAKVADNSEKKIKPENLFPLARANNNKNGLTFAWGQTGNKTDRTPANNQILVLRLRDEMVASAGLHLVEFASEVNQKFDNSLREFLKGINSDLQKLLQNEVLLRDITAEDMVNRSVPQWWQSLWQITEITYPGG